MDETKDIELRSEKVRNIIGQIPPRIVRVGITVMFMIVTAILAGAYFLKFENTIKTSADLSLQNDSIQYTILISYPKFKHIKTGQKIVIIIQGTHPINTSVQEIDSTIFVNNKQSCIRITGVIRPSGIMLTQPIKAPASIYIGKSNVIDKALNK